MSSSAILISVWMLLAANLACTWFCVAVVIRIWRLEMSRRPKEEKDIEL